MPKMLARDNGKEWMAEVLKEWPANKDRDLRERKGEVGSGSGSGTGKKASFMGGS
jgi:hypothetical protein